MTRKHSTCCGVLEQWQKKGVHFDYFTLDTGWVDPNSDLTRFRPTCFPNGPGEIVRRVNALGMKFGLWFATSWAAESCWDYPPALAGQPPISMPYRLGYPDKAHEGRLFCFGSEPYFQTLKKAVLYHVRENHVRWLKFDGGNYTCDSTEHGHLPGKYSVEPMFAHLIDMAASARAVAPDVRVMWYYGCSSPFWALYGDFIFESGLANGRLRHERLSHAVLPGFGHAHAGSRRAICPQHPAAQQGQPGRLAGRQPLGQFHGQGTLARGARDGPGPRQPALPQPLGRRLPP